MFSEYYNNGPGVIFVIKKVVRGKIKNKTDIIVSSLGWQRFKITFKRVHVIVYFERELLLVLIIN